MESLYEKVNNDINEYDDVFSKLTKWAYFFILPIGCFWWFRLVYMPIIWNKWFNQPANVQFPNCDADWGFFHKLFYESFHPPMYMAEYFNSCTDSGVWWYLLASMPGFIVVFSIIFLIVDVIIYWSIWNHIVGPAIGAYLRPIVDSACMNIRR